MSTERASSFEPRATSLRQLAPRSSWLAVAALFSVVLRAQSPYIAPSDPSVKEKLREWEDLKFGLLMHWGTYSQWGVVESWSICPEDEGWCRRDSSHGATYNEYVRNYEALQTTFDPVRFDPAKWAKAAKEAGMKYMVFTTKHHDGFCMFDTKTTDYRITSPNTPFHDDPRANVTKEIFSAFRNEGLWTGAYFSKPDWHSDDYWWRNFPPKDRSVNYLPAKYPERWKAFQDFTYAQIEELMTGYGTVDILWLDGGWVRPFNSIDTSVSWQKAITIEQDIDMKRLAEMARSHQPALLVVDRTVGGEYENYVTPEGHVPDHDLGMPWETCMPMGTSWSWVPNEKYKSSLEVIKLLSMTVTSGGSLLLNIAPDPSGQWDPVAYQRLKEVGAWVMTNKEAIYDTRGMPLYQDVIIGSTISKDGRSIYLFGDDAGTWEIPWPRYKKPTATIIGSGQRLTVKLKEGIAAVVLPDELLPVDGEKVVVVELQSP